MEIQINRFSEPILQYGNGEGFEPRKDLRAFGPLTKTPLLQLNLGLVGAEHDIVRCLEWIDILNRPAVTNESNAKRFRQYPGAPKAWGISFCAPSHFIRKISDSAMSILINRVKEKISAAIFEEALSLFCEQIESLCLDRHPEAIIIILPEVLGDLSIQNPLLTEREKRILEEFQSDVESEQIGLFELDSESIRVAEDLLTYSQDLIFRNFCRALKARAMQISNCPPIQIIRSETIARDSERQSEATRAWNLSLALYYKAGNIPWKLRDLPPSRCFVGISFHHLKTREGELVYASTAQAFSTEIEPFALKGSYVPREQRRDKQPYLNQDQAASVIEKIIAGYKRQAGVEPSQIVIHKSTPFQPEEKTGFIEQCEKSEIDCRMVSIGPTGFRLAQRGNVEPPRGTCCKISQREGFLFTTGYIPWWDSYPGPHIPAPLRLIVEDGIEFDDRASEILALTKMNWNSSDGIGAVPITLSFARRVGLIMTEMGDSDAINPLYRYYM